MAKATPKRGRTFADLVNSYPAPVRQLAGEARAFIRGVLPDVDESVDASGPYIGYGYGPGYKGMVCTLILSQSGVKLGIVGGAELADPHRLLEGSGRTHRHVVLNAPPDLQRPGIRELVAAGDRASRRRMSER